MTYHRHSCGTVSGPNKRSTSSDVFISTGGVATEYFILACSIFQTRQGWCPRYGTCEPEDDQHNSENKILYIEEKRKKD